MTLARKYLISPEDTPYYHVMSRCVRRAFLCGKDKYSGNCYEHRRQPIVDRIKFLAGVFKIDVCSYAIMSNHYHLVLKINSTEKWSEKQVLTYWSELCNPKLICQKFLNNEPQSKAELEMVYLQTDIYRKRLMSISWFMKLLNEHIARSANIEENITGSFWESRFKSQALLDEKALLSCMAYVDLNPIRAGMAQTPEGSDFTSIQERITKKSSTLLNLGFGNNTIDFTLADYCDLVDATGRSIRADKKGFINHSLPPILVRLGIDDVTWLDELNQFKFKGRKAIGTIDKLKQYVNNIKNKIKRDIGLNPALE
jgi:REP element-mobilizing transposase RayT